MPTLSESDVVAVLGAPGPRWVATLHAIWDVGAAVLPVDSRLPAAERDHLLRHARPTVISAGGDSRRVDGVPASPATAAVLATSGTSGAPRLVELSREALLAAVTSSAERLGTTSEDRWLCCIPVAHIGGLLVLLRHVMLGAPLTVHGRFDAEAVCRSGARFTSIVPTQLRRLLDCGCDLGGFRALLVGGAALPAELGDAASRAGAHTVSTYGLTETCGGVVYDGQALSGTEVRLGEGGEVQLRGPTLMSRYRFDPAATENALTSDGWLRTRDAGSLSDDGVLHVLGRLDDVIVSGGEKIWPLEVEGVLALHPQVAEVAVTGWPSPEWGEEAVAHVVPHRADDPPSLESLRDFAATRLARYKAPRALVIVESLERTVLGKVRRNRLAG